MIGQSWLEQVRINSIGWWDGGMGVADDTDDAHHLNSHATWACEHHHTKMLDWCEGYSNS